MLRTFLNLNACIGFTEIDDARFGQDTLNILINMCSQICTVLRYSLRGGQAGLEAIATRFVVELDSLKSDTRIRKEFTYVSLTRFDCFVLIA